MMGAFLGWKLVLPVLFASSLLGGLFGIGLIAARRGEASTPIPFGVFLAPVGFLALLYGDAALSWYLGLGTN
jgi:leader peptidase (prepilin peptidase)/N-methyltransferase